MELWKGKLMLKSYFTLFVTPLLVVPSTSAQQPASIDLGGFELTPLVTYSLTHDDNVIRSNSDEEIDSWINTLSPEFILLNNYGGNLVQFGYKLETAKYISSKTDNYTDHFLTAAFDYELNSRHRFSTNAMWEDGHDNRGTMYSIANGDLLNEPDKYKNIEIFSRYSYGAQESKAGLDISAGYIDIDYDLNTDLYRIRDRYLALMGAVFSYDIAPSTELSLDLSRQVVEYDFVIDGQASLDSTVNLLLLGVEWESTAQTSGYAKVGYRRKEFADPLRTTFSDVDWRLGVTWEPIERTELELTTLSNTRETNGEGSFIQQRIYRADWEHRWLDRVVSTVRLNYLNNQYIGIEGGTLRDDDTIQFEAGLSYHFRRWVEFNLSFIKNKRDSSQERIEFDQNQLIFSTTISL